MGVHHFTYDEDRKAYRVHFEPGVPKEEVDAAMWIVASYTALVEGVTQEQTDSQPVIRFTLYPDRDPGRSLSRLCKTLKPQMPFTLQFLQVTSIQERCGRHNATHIKATFWHGLVPDVDIFAADMTVGLLEPRARGFQLRRDRRGLLAEIKSIHEAIGAFQQGETTVIFERSQKPCPDCATETAHLN